MTKQSIAVRKVSESLPCKLSDTERLEFADLLAQANQGVESAEANKKSMLAQMTSEVKLAQARREKLTNIVSTGTEYRDVTVEEKLDYEAGKYIKTRTDTGEVIIERRMTDKEKQTSLLQDGQQFSETN